MAISLSPRLPSDAVPPPRTDDPVVIVGTGPVGIRMAEELLRANPRQPVVVYGDEPWEPYQRIRLSALLMGEIGWGAIDNRLRLPDGHRVVVHQHCAVIAIDRRARTVRDIQGNTLRYSRLILATGSRPYLPEIPGRDRLGVFTFRDLGDVQKLMARRVRSRHAVVLGGGLLGIEAARALARYSTSVTIVQHAPRLMNRQLDDTAAGLLHRHVESGGIRLRLGDGVRTILGGRTVESLQLMSGETVLCDTLVVATGIQPNIQLALDAGLSVGRGIRVDDELRTSDPDIFAVGECAEHRGQIIGLLAPGLEQATIVAHGLKGEPVRYEGSVAATHLKVAGLTVFSVGETGDDEDPLVHRIRTFIDPRQGIYRKLLLRHGRLVGAIGVGEWPEANAVQEAVRRGRRASPLALWRFSRQGVLWSEPGADGVAFWPASVRVCNCAAVTRGLLSEAVTAGCATVECLAKSTGAGRVCGSCRPLLAELLGAQAEPLKVGGVRLLLGSSVASLLLLFGFLLVGGFPEAGSAGDGAWPRRLWIDGFWKQVSGYTLMALALFTVALSLRKRWQRFTAGRYDAWRTLHVTFGVVMMIALVLHTGLHLGNNLNFLLLTGFLLTTKAGSIVALVTGLERRPSRAGRRWKSWSGLLHILLVWPLPVLLVFHVLSVYYF